MKKKRIKKYQPKPIKPHAAFEAIHLAKPIDEKARQKLQDNARIAFDVFTKGYAEPRHYDDLALLVDMSLLLSSRFFENEYMAEIKEAQGALLRACDRFHKLGRFGFDGEGLDQMKTIMAVHFEMLGQVTGKEYMTVMEARKKLVASGAVYESEQDRLEKMKVAA